MIERVEAVVCVRCRWCRSLFGVCRSCYRGQAYCGVACREAGSRRRQRQARDRHQRTPEGRQDHRDRMRALRARRRQTCDAKASQARASATPAIEAVTDGGSAGKLASAPLRCVACGCHGVFVVDKPPRPTRPSSHGQDRRGWRALPRPSSSAQDAARADAHRRRGVPLVRPSHA